MNVVALPQIDPPAIDVARLCSTLREAISGEVRFERLDRALYSTDASVYQIVPLGVVIPKTPDDVIATLKICSRFGVPITARGGGTSQAGQSIGPGVILDFSKYLHRILEVNAGEKWVRVEPGCVLDDLNLHVKSHGLLFAPDISTANRATIGGMVANNSSGTHSVILGKTIDHVLELKVLLADGSVIDTSAATEHPGFQLVRRLATEHADEIERRFPKILRRVGGYNLDSFAACGLASEVHRPAATPQAANLCNLFVGSEGTLGIVLEAKLRLVELPKAKALLVVQFADLLDALAATPMILTHGPSAVEVMDRFILDCTKLNADAVRLRDFIVGDPGAILIVEFYGNDAAELLPRVEALEAALRALNVNVHRALDAAAQARIWKLRTLALGLSMAEKGDAKAISFVEDTAVAPEHLRDYIDKFLQVIARHGTKAGVYAHASVGCLHVRPIVNLKSVEGVQQFQAIADEVADLVLKYGGALSGEHGDGLVRSPFQEKMYGPVLYQAFREIKRAFDPHNLLNPGKIVDAPPLASSLRYGPAYVTPDVPTTFDFSADGGLTRATELCAGVGECRKKRGGTMCPSFQATGDELHSTRGRANTLRLALTGQLDVIAACDSTHQPRAQARGLAPAASITQEEVLAALDLCLECKACKTECPTNVDMARLKAEVLDQHHKKHGLPWRNWLFGNVARLSAWGCTLAPMSNWIAQSGVGRWFNEKAFGIDRRRKPPRFAGAPFWRSSEADWHSGHDRHASASLLFFPDTFVNFHEPEIGTAALRLLQQSSAVFGPPSIVMTPSRWRCCGRPQISTGMLDKAIVNAAHNTKWLYDWGGPILACEPSCILTIKDDYPALLKGELREKAKAVAERCFTFEEFLEQRLTETTMTFKPGPKRILVQGHCHQRSLVGMGPTLKLLRRIPGAEVIDLDAGCCGMAGSFGYEKEHYEISRLVGEQRLFPAIRAADPETVIVAPGFSCRLQIEHFTGRKALHPATLLQSLLD